MDLDRAEMIREAVDEEGDADELEIFIEGLMLGVEISQPDFRDGMTDDEVMQYILRSYEHRVVNNEELEDE